MIASREPPTYTKKDDQNENKYLVFYDQSHLTMEVCTIDLVSNAYAELLTDNTRRPLPIFSAEQLYLEGQWEVAISQLSYPSMYQKVTERKFLFFNKALSKTSEFYYREAGLYPSMTDLFEGMITPFHDRHTGSENSITVSVSENAQD